MTLGRLAANSIPAGANTLIYTTPSRSSGIEATVNICNRNTVDATIRLAIVPEYVDSLDMADYIEYDVVVRPGGVIERKGIQLIIGQSIVGYSDVSNVTFQMWG